MASDQGVGGGMTPTDPHDLRAEREGNRIEAKAIRKEIKTLIADATGDAR